VSRQLWCSVYRATPDALSRTYPKTSMAGFFGAFSRRILHAPTYDVHATEEVQRHIVEAIRQFPARRAAEFQTFERPSYERLGWPSTVLDQIAPHADAPLKGATFICPVLLAALIPTVCVGRDGGT
jgi:hypothetical protein